MLCVDSKLRLCGVFLHRVTQRGSKEKGTAAECGVQEFGSTGCGSSQPWELRMQGGQSEFRAESENLPG